MEPTPYTNAEQDTSDDDDDDDSESLGSKKKKTSKVARSITGVSIAGVTTPKPEAKSDLRPSRGERFLRLAEDRPTKNLLKDEVETDAAEADEEKEDTVPLTDTAVEQDEAAEPVTEQKSSDSLTDTLVPLESITKENTAPETEIETEAETAEYAPPKIQGQSKVTPSSALEAADWEPEGELNEDTEIDLTNEAQHFVDVPVAETEPATEEDPVEQPVEPELLATGLGAEGPPEPPETSIDEADPASHGPQRPARDNPNSPWHNVAAMAGPTAAERQRELDAAEHAGRVSGTHRGVLTGLVAGWLFGRRGKKKAAAEHAKQLKAKEKEIVSLKNTPAALTPRVEAIPLVDRNIRQEVASAVPGPANESGGLIASPEHAAEAGISPESAVGQTAAPSVEKPFLKASEQVLKRTLEAVPGLIALTAARSGSEQVNYVAAPAEKPPTALESISAPEKQRTAEQAPESQTPEEDAPETPEGRRVETSAWHRIELDAKTGKVVNDPEVAYGEEFKREQKQEVLREDRPKSSSNGPASFLGGLATSSVTTPTPPTSQATYNDGESSDLHVPRPQEPPHPHLTAGNELLRYASIPAVWVAAALIVVALFLFGILQ